MHMLDNNNCFAFNEDDEDIKFQNVTLTRSVSISMKRMFPKHSKNREQLKQSKAKQELRGSNE